MVPRWVVGFPVISCPGKRPFTPVCDNPGMAIGTPAGSSGVAAASVSADSATEAIGAPADPANDAADTFEAYRGRLFGLAYRMLGSAAEAEDVVQDAYLPWHAADRDALTTPGAWLTKVVTNLCLNRLGSARVRREQYAGQWLPEPVLTADGALGPLDTAERRESVSLALLVLMERLTPAERAVFVLREAFGYRYREIAGIMELGEANCRQLGRRARLRVAADGPAPAAVPAEPQGANRWELLVDGFLTAAREGDLTVLERLLTDDVTSWADGGGAVNVARHPVRGHVKVARYVTGVFGRYGPVELSSAEVNGTPAVLAWVGGQLIGVLAMDVRDGRISAIRIIANPGKLGCAARQAGGLSRF